MHYYEVMWDLWRLKSPTTFFLYSLFKLTTKKLQSIALLNLCDGNPSDMDDLLQWHIYASPGYIIDLEWKIVC